MVHKAIVTCVTDVLTEVLDVLYLVFITKRQFSYKIVLVLIENESSRSFPHFDKLGKFDISLYCLHKVKIHWLLYKSMNCDCVVQTQA